MTNDEIKELMIKGQNDGAQLFRVADAIYKVNLFFIFIIAIIGAVLFFVAMNRSGFGSALAVVLATTAVCAIAYAIAVLGSNGAKVLVHLLFSNLAILEKQQGKDK